MWGCVRFLESAHQNRRETRARELGEKAERNSRTRAEASVVTDRRFPAWFARVWRKRTAKSSQQLGFDERQSTGGVKVDSVHPARVEIVALERSPRTAGDVVESKSLSVRRGLGKLTLSQTELEFSSVPRQPDEYGASVCNWGETIVSPETHPQQSVLKLPASTAGDPLNCIDGIQNICPERSTRFAQGKLEDASFTGSEKQTIKNSATIDHVDAAKGHWPLEAKHLRFIRLIGSGSFASVQLAVYKDSIEPIAIKVMDSTCHRFQITSEIVILRLAREYGCKNIVRFHGSIEEDGHVMILMEHMDVGSIDGLYRRSVVKGLPEPVVRAIAWQTLRALQFVHVVCHRVHRDVKPSNLLINHKGEVKLADFGLSSSSSLHADSQRESCEARPQASLREGKFVGTCLYMAPEMLRASPYDSRADIYSLGISLLECFLGKNPNYDDYLNSRGHLDLVMTLLEKGSPEIPKDARMSQNAREFFSLCLETNYTRRPLCHTLLSHRWFDLLKIPQSISSEQFRSFARHSARFSSQCYVADVPKDGIDTHALENHPKRNIEEFSDGRQRSDLFGIPSGDTFKAKNETVGDEMDIESKLSATEYSIADENACNELVTFLRLLGLVPSDANDSLRRTLQK